MKTGQSRLSNERGMNCHDRGSDACKTDWETEGQLGVESFRRCSLYWYQICACRGEGELLWFSTFWWKCMVVCIPTFLCSTSFNRKQWEGKSLLDYSYAWMALKDQVVKTDEQASVKSQKVLGDTFCDGICDQTLGEWLRDKVSSNPPWTICYVRKEAAQWVA